MIAKLRSLFDAITNAIPPWPSSELPLIRHRPMADDDELEYVSDYLYLTNLADEIEDTCVWTRQPPRLEPDPFWWEQDPWPADRAAVLLRQWRDELDIFYMREVAA